MGGERKLASSKDCCAPWASECGGPCGDRVVAPSQAAVPLMQKAEEGKRTGAEESLVLQSGGVGGASRFTAQRVLECSLPSSPPSGCLTVNRFPPPPTRQGGNSQPCMTGPDRGNLFFLIAPSSSLVHGLNGPLPLSGSLSQ